MEPWVTFRVVVPTVSSEMSWPSSESRAPVNAVERHRRITRLRGVEILPVLQLDARLQLRQIEEVPPVDRQIIDLLLRQNVLHLGLLRVDPNRPRLHFHHLRAAAHRHVQVAVADVPICTVTVALIGANPDFVTETRYVPGMSGPDV
jgi:hypothetical protein